MGDRPLPHTSTSSLADHRPTILFPPSSSPISAIINSNIIISLLTINPLGRAGAHETVGLNPSFHTVTFIHWTLLRVVMWMLETDGKVVVSMVAAFLQNMSPTRYESVPGRGLLLSAARSQHCDGDRSISILYVANAILCMCVCDWIRSFYCVYQC